MSAGEYVPFEKISRLRRECVVTEKIDGTNACIFVPEDGGSLGAGSRTRWITPEQDNFGFAAWVQAHAEELRALGPGKHFGEWWGAGIQRRYGLTEKRFSLFNVARWNALTPPPDCCHVVPVIARLPTFDTNEIGHIVHKLSLQGSLAARGFMKPEGVVVYHMASGHLYKQTIEKDDAPKGAKERT